jgi:hypothetical protein
MLNLYTRDTGNMMCDTCLLNIFFQLKTPIDLVGWIQLVPGQVVYSGKINLNQFYVIKTSVKTQKSDSVLNVEMIFQVILFYLLSNI